ncbi:MAG TPA: hypothetical protein VFN10_00155 [Thermoanaerobaculia bacterium]|nr:hypothetical protein [Thermoanaerobaculia bacterium]
MRKVIVVLVLIAAACASSTSSGPAVSIEQTSSVAALLAETATRVPVDYQLKIANRFDRPLVLRSVEIETMGVAGAYALPRVRHVFNTTVAPREATTVNLRAWVQPLVMTNEGQVVTSVLLRGVATFDDGGKRVKSAFTTRAQQ